MNFLLLRFWFYYEVNWNFKHYLSEFLTLYVTAYTVNDGCCLCLFGRLTYCQVHRQALSLTNGSIYLPGYWASENETGSQICNELLYFVHLGVFYCLLKVGDALFLTFTILDEIACSELSKKAGFSNPVRGIVVDI